MIGVKRKKLIGKICLYIALIVLASFIVVPLYLVLLNSLKTTEEAAILSFDLPQTLRFSNYLEAIREAEVFRSMRNSLIVSVSSVVTVILTSSMAAFIVARREEKLTKVIYYFIIAGLVAPIAIIPEIRLMQLLGLNKSFLAVIFVNIASNIPFTFFLFSGFIQGIPREMDESALMDGCKPLRMFFRIMLPLLKPVLFTAIIFIFMATWNDFQYALYFIPKSSMYTMPQQVYNFMGFHTADMNLICAYMVLTATPVIIVYLFAQKYIISGVTAGAIKG